MLQHPRPLGGDDLRLALGEPLALTIADPGDPPRGVAPHDLVAELAQLVGEVRPDQGPDLVLVHRERVRRHRGQLAVLAARDVRQGHVAVDLRIRAGAGRGRGRGEPGGVVAELRGEDARRRLAEGGGAAIPLAHQRDLRWRWSSVLRTDHPPRLLEASPFGLVGAGPEDGEVLGRGPGQVMGRDVLAVGPRGDQRVAGGGVPVAPDGGERLPVDLLAVEPQDGSHLMPLASPFRLLALDVVVAAARPVLLFLISSAQQVVAVLRDLSRLDLRIRHHWPLRARVVDLTTPVICSW